MKRKKYKKRKLKTSEELQKTYERALLDSVPSEEECISILKEIYLGMGIVCPKCKGKDHYWKADKNNFECKKCRYRTSLKVNTIMNRSRLPIHYWVVALNIIIVNYHKKLSVSIKEANERLHNSRYESIFYLCNKLKMKIEDMKTAEDMETVCTSMFIIKLVYLLLESEKKLFTLLNLLIRLGA